MDFRTGGGSEIRPKGGGGTKVTVGVPHPDSADVSDFFKATTASFSFAQITMLMFGVVAGPLAEDRRIYESTAASFDSYRKDA